MDTNYIKMDGEPDKFEGGAIRYSKRGKGRFDLLPGEVVYLIIEYGELIFKESDTIQVSLSDIIKDAYIDDVNRYIQTIFDFIAIEYAQGKIVDEKSHVIELTYTAWFDGFVHALKDLAIHYEYGAEKYGVDNWKHGIPLIGGDRGGSFTDSGLRHLNQYLSGETDEKHGVAFMWNFVNAIYLQQESKRISNECKTITNDDVYTFDDDDITD